MRRASDLEQRLVEWGREYGGGRYERESGSGSWLSSMMKWHGRPPSGLGYVASCTAADEVQKAVEALSQHEGGLIPACVLSCEYLTPGQPLESKLHRLRQRGDNLGKTSYYKHLRKARQFVAGHLNLAAPDDDQENDACLA